MTAKDLILRAFDVSREQAKMFLSDLSDADLLVRPVPGSNHIAWQFGHVLCAELRALRALSGGPGPELPAGFEEAHAKDRANSDTGFSTMATYLATLDTVRNATVHFVKTMSDEDLAKPNTGPTGKRWPTIADLCLLISAFHPTLHTGQYTVVRRKLGKPVLF
jgi:DinB superfamily